MKSIKRIIILFFISINFYLFFWWSYVNWEDVNISSTVKIVDQYYDKFFDYVDSKTSSIRFKRIKIKIEDRLRSSLLSGINKKLASMSWDQKIIFQSLWSKIRQRKENIKYTTNDIIVQRELINLINDFRISQWLSSLSYNSNLTRAAYNHANDLYLNFPYDSNWDWIKENLSHLGTDWSRVNSRVESLWYDFSFVAENIAYNQTSASQVLLDRKNSATHYSNLITQQAKDIWVAKIGSYRVLVLGSQRLNN